MGKLSSKRPPAELKRCRSGRPVCPRALSRQARRLAIRFSTLLSRAPGRPLKGTNGKFHTAMVPVLPVLLAQIISLSEP